MRRPRPGNCPPQDRKDWYGDAVPDDPKLIKRGWTRRFIADPARAEEVTAFYPTIGYEVKTREVARDDLGPDCSGCAESVCRKYVVVYTRMKKG